MISSVVIDRRVLDSFKRRALKALPQEYAEQLWGKVCRGRAQIYHIEPFDLESRTKATVDFTFDHDCGTKQDGIVLLGSVHTHPQAVCEPSETDLNAAVEDGEIVFGICAIRSTPKRRFVSWGFWTQDGRKVELQIGE